MDSSPSSDFLEHSDELLNLNDHEYYDPQGVIQVSKNAKKRMEIISGLSDPNEEAFSKYRQKITEKKTQ